MVWFETAAAQRRKNRADVVRFICGIIRDHLVKIHNDLVTSIDQGHVGALVLLDMSSAFDTVDHQLLIRILQYRLSINDSALAWFNSYLSDRSQTVHVNSSISRTVNLSCGMP